MFATRPIVSGYYLARSSVRERFCWKAKPPLSAEHCFSFCQYPILRDYGTRPRVDEPGFEEMSENQWHPKNDSRQRRLRTYVWGKIYRGAISVD